MPNIIKVQVKFGPKILSQKHLVPMDNIWSKRNFGKSDFDNMPDLNLGQILSRAFPLYFNPKQSQNILKITPKLDKIFKS